MADISQIKLPNNTVLDIKDAVARAYHEPIETKTYTDVIGTSNDMRGGAFFYLKVRGTTYNMGWRVKVRVRASVPGSSSYTDLYYTDSTAQIWGMQNTYGGYIIENRIRNTNYRPFYYHNLFRVSQTGYNNGCGSWIGFNLLYSANPINANYKRTVIVDLLEYENCEVEFQDELITPDNIPDRSSHTNWYSSTNTSFDNFDAFTQGWRSSGDANTVNISQINRGNGNLYADSVIYRYQMLFHVDEDTLTPLNNNDNIAATTKTMLTDVEFNPFMPVYYYALATTVNTGAAINASYITLSYPFDLRYTFNVTTTQFTAHKPLYLILTPTSNGKAKIASSLPLTQELPTSNDGYWYMYLGRMYSAYQLMLYPEHRIFIHNGTDIQQILPQDALATGSVAGLMSSDEKTKLSNIASGATANVAATASPKMDGTATVGTSEKYAREDHVHPSDTTKLEAGSEIMSTNPFTGEPTLHGSKALYIPKIDNALYCADKRFNVTVSGDYSQFTGVQNLFNGNYDSEVLRIPNGSSVTITISFDTTSNGYFPGYPYGDIYCSFYYIRRPLSITGRVYCNYEAHGVGWHDLTFKKRFSSGSTYCAHNSYFNISVIEITIEGAENGDRTSLSEIDMWLERPDPRYTPFVSKYVAETLYYDLTAPSFIGSGASLTNLDASNLTSGTIPAARLPAATSSTLGAVKVGTNLSMNNGVLSATDTTYSAATTSASGLMSAADKTKLDGIATGATANAGTITGITMNGASKGTSGVVDLGTVLTAHQDISGKADKVSSATSGNFAALDSNGNLTDSGHKHSDYLTVHQDISGKANIASPTFTGIPAAPTAANGTSTTQIATTEFVQNAISAIPAASTSTLGLVKVGTNLSIDANGVLSSTDTNTHRPIQVKGTQILGNNTTALNFAEGDNITITNSSGTITISATDTNTKNTAGSTNTSSKIFLIGATSQAANPQTYSQDTAYVGTDGCLYSGGAKVLTAHQSLDSCVKTSGTQTASGTKTWTGSCLIQNSVESPSIQFKSTPQESTTGIIYYMNTSESDTSTDYTQGRFYFQEYSPASNGKSRTSYYERYRLPAVAKARSANATYDILTTNGPDIVKVVAYSYKVATEIASGGTCAITANQLGMSVPSGYTPLAIRYFTTGSPQLFAAAVSANASGSGDAIVVKNTGGSKVSANVITVRITVAYILSNILTT